VILLGFEANLIYFVLLDQAVDLAAVTTFLLEELPSMKSSSRESKETMALSYYMLESLSLSPSSLS